VKTTFNKEGERKGTEFVMKKLNPRSGFVKRKREAPACLPFRKCRKGEKEGGKRIEH